MLLLSVTTSIALAQEPTEHVTNVEALPSSGTETTSITVTWDPAGGAVAPEAYLVTLVTGAGTEVAVTDGVVALKTDDTDLANNNAHLNITFGTNEAIFTGLSPNTSYDFKVYTYTTSGTTDPDFKTDGTVPSITARTLATEPTTDPANLTVGTVTGSSIELTWPLATTGTGVIVIARAGSAVAATPTDGENPTANAAFGSGDDLGTNEFVVYKGTGTTETVTGLSSGTTYHFVAYAYNGDPGSENYYLTGTPPTASSTPPADATATITAIAGNNATIPTTAVSSGTAQTVFDFKVTDVAGTDNVGIIISEMTFTEAAGGTGNTVADWSQVIGGIVLSDGTNDYTLAAASGDLTIGAASIQIQNIPANLGTIASTTNKDYTLSIYFNTSLPGSLPETIDNENLSFAISSANIVSSGTSFNGVQSTEVNSGNNIAVTATQFIVATQPSATAIRDRAIDTPPVFWAVDANGNLDVNYNENIITTTSPDRSPQNTPGSFSNGIATFPGNFELDGIGNTVIRVIHDQGNPGEIISEATNTVSVLQRIDITRRTGGVEGSANNGTQLETTATNIALAGFAVRREGEGNDGSFTGFTIDLGLDPTTVFSGYRIHRSNNGDGYGSGDNEISTYTITPTATGFTVTLNRTLTDDYDDNRLFFVVDVEPTVNLATTFTITIDPDLFTYGSNSGSDPNDGVMTYGQYEFVDVAGPALNSFTPADDAFAVPVNANIVLNFSENLTKNLAGNRSIRIRRSSNDNIFAEYDNNADPEVTVNNSTVTINPANPLAAGVEYYIEWDEGVFQDNQNNPVNAIADKTTFNFTAFATPTITIFDSNSCIGNEITILGNHYSEYPSTTSETTSGVLSVDFCDGAGANCVTQNTVTYVNNGEIRAVVPSGAPSGKIRINRSSENTGIGTNAAVQSGLSSGDLTLGVPILPDPGSPLSVCSNDDLLVYAVDDNATNGFTYEWAEGSNLTQAFESQARGAVINVGTGSGNTTLQVTKIRDSDQCESSYTFNITVNPTPNVVFDPQTEHANNNPTDYTLVLEDNANNPIPNGQAGIEPWVEFSGSGVIKEESSPNDIFNFRSDGLNAGQFYTVSYFHQDVNGCVAQGSEEFEIYDGEGSIVGLSSNYCADNTTANLITPETGGLPVTNMWVEYNNQAYFSGQGMGLNGGPGAYTFTASEVGQQLTVDESSRVLTVWFEYYNALTFTFFYGNSFTQVHEIPSAEFTIEENLLNADDRRIQNILPFSDEFCETADPVNLVIDSYVDGTEANRIVNFTTDNNPANTILEGPWRFDPSEVAFADPITGTTVAITYEYTQIHGTAHCFNSQTQSVNVYPQPETPIITRSDLEPLSSFNGNDPNISVDPGTDLICVVNEVPLAGITNRHTPDANTTIKWYNNSVASGGELSNQDEFAAVINTLQEGPDNIYSVTQTYDDRAESDNFCASEPLVFMYEYFQNLDFENNSSVLTQDPTLTSQVGIIDANNFEWNIRSLNNSTEIGPYIYQVSGDGFDIITPSGFYSDLFEVELIVTSANGCDANLTKNLMFFEKLDLGNSLATDFDFTSNYPAIGDPGAEKRWFSVNEVQSASNYQKLQEGDIWLHNEDLKGFDRYEQDTTAYATRLRGDGTRLVPNLEKGHLISPALNLSQIERPMVVLDINFNMADDADGFVLQYTTETKIDENTEWNTVGNIQSGVNWYNVDGINSKPGNQDVNVFGWTEANSLDFENINVGIPDDGWIESKHQIEAIEDRDGAAVDLGSESNVIFRISFASDDDGDFPPTLEPDETNGFAITKFFVGSRTRTVLVENFSNIGGGNIVENENSQLQNFVDNNQGQIDESSVILLNYRTGFPDATDPLYRQTPGLAGARSNFYNIKGNPRSRMDGLQDLNNEDLPWSAWGEDFYNERSLSLAQADVQLSTNLIGPANSATGLDISVDLTPVAQDIPAGAALFVAVVQEERLTDPNDVNSEIIQSFVKKLLPGGAGYYFTDTLRSGETTSLNFEYIFEDDDIEHPINLVAFLQDTREIGFKEIYQSDIMDLGDLLANKTLVLSVDQSKFSEGINLYPNPARNSVLLNINEPATNDFTVRLYDSYGALVQHSNLQYGENSLSLDVSRLANGMYQVLIQTTDGQIAGVKKLLVNR